MITIHSEKEIFNGCVALMQMLMYEFEEYLDFIGFTPKNDEEKFHTEFNNTRIVKELLLLHAKNSGGASQCEKCQELGIEDDGTVCFEDKRHEQ